MAGGPAPDEWEKDGSADGYSLDVDVTSTLLQSEWYDQSHCDWRSRR